MVFSLIQNNSRTQWFYKIVIQKYFQQHAFFKILLFLQKIIMKEILFVVFLLYKIILLNFSLNF